MLGDTTGWVKLPSALRCCHRHKIEAVGREKIAGRHLTLPVGRVFLQNLQPTATEDKAKHGSTFQGIYAPTMSLIIVMTQRDMCLGSRTTNHAFPCMMAQRTKYATLISNACKPIKQTRPNSYHQFKEQGMHARCNAT